GLVQSHPDVPVRIEAESVPDTGCCIEVVGVVITRRTGLARQGAKRNRYVLVGGEIGEEERIGVLAGSREDAMTIDACHKAEVEPAALAGYIHARVCRIVER